jgi:hypothetical protein
MSEIKVNKISPRTNCGTVQLGDSGDTITIPSGASITNSGTASGFGATGAASWNTTVKTSTFTAVSGEGYFVNTTGGAVTVNLPAGTAGAVVAVKDYANTFDTNAVTLVQNGSDKIGGSTDNVVLGEEGISVTLVFVDSTKGWLVTDSGLQSEATVPEFISASGGTITTVCTNFKVHTFTGPGTFTVTCAGNSAGSNTVDYLVIGGGGGGGASSPPDGSGGGGGGAGGYRESGGTASGCYAVSPLGSSPSSVAALPVSAQGYPIAVGGGGATSPGPANPNAGTSGVNSNFSIITSNGGGGGGGGASTAPSGLPGGSGGGAGNINGSGTAGTGNTPPTTPPQGNNGGQFSGPATTPGYGSGGGGGATAVGGAGTNSAGGAGGAGATSSINGTPTARAGGGGGALYCGPVGGAGGSGGGGAGGGNPGGTASVAGTTNTGGGGGGRSRNAGAAGGSGIVVIRYKFQ